MKLALRLAASVLLLGLLLAYLVDLREAAAIVRKFSPAWLAAAFAVVTIDRVLMAYKWALLLRAQGCPMPLWHAVSMYCTSMVWGLALPTTVGADAIRAVMATRRGLGAPEVLTSIVIERMVGFVMALALGLVCLTILRSLGVLDAAFDKTFLLGAAMLLGAVGLLAASLDARLTAALARRLPRIARESMVMRKLEQFAAAYRSLGGSRRVIGVFALLTAAEQLFSVTFSWTLAKGMDVPVNLLLLLGVLPLSTLISRLPISFDGLGVFEFVFVGLLMLAGVQPSASFAIALSGRIIQLLAFLPWWFVYAVQSGARRATPRAVLAGDQRGLSGR
ncbi:MAG: lysylphosphatidylglycerol synthase transmembrane domain-containing protein [Steroidobacteraceae bacterium]|nr:lysylphosphatidylglycerol synthase transmembrane domain-containing protein [Steroidobacteraceae bacterium]